MPNYTLYCFESFKLVQCERFAAPDDEAAVAQAVRLQGGRAAELWDDEGRRKVRNFHDAAAV